MEQAGGDVGYSVDVADAGIFTNLALWAGWVLESPCPYVCMCVCMSVIKVVLSITAKVSDLLSFFIN